jgi:putative redox protein
MQRMHAELTWRGQVQFTATTGSGHTLEIDGPPDAGGANRGPRPMELVLVGLGGCSAFDVVTILGKSRQDIADCVTEVDAERSDAVPHVFTRIHLRFKVSGRGLDEKKVARAVSLSAEKYCSASIMLQRGGVEVTHDYLIEELG